MGHTWWLVHYRAAALVAQGIERRPPEPGAQVRILPRARRSASASLGEVWRPPGLQTPGTTHRVVRPRPHSGRFGGPQASKLQAPHTASFGLGLTRGGLAAPRPPNSRHHTPRRSASASLGEVWRPPGLQTPGTTHHVVRPSACWCGRAGPTVTCGYGVVGGGPPPCEPEVVPGIGALGLSRLA